MVASTTNAGLFSRLVRRLSLWLQPRAPHQRAHFSHYRQCSAWFRPRREVSAQALETRAKRQDLVRRREFEHLRSLRASAVWPPSAMDSAPAAGVQPLPKPKPKPTPASAPSAMARAQTLQKIDAIEALMSSQKADGGVNRPAGSGWAPGHRSAMASGAGEGADPDPAPDPDDGATRLGSASDPYPAKPLKPGAA
jgi:hypothetical protein